MSNKLSICKACSTVTNSARYSPSYNGVVCNSCFRKMKNNYKESVSWKRFWQKYTTNTVKNTVPHAFYKDDKVSLCGKVNKEDDHWITSEESTEVDGCRRCEQLIEKRCK